MRSVFASLKKGQNKLDRWKEQAIKKLKNGKAPGADRWRC